nr:hypothetical protein Iba_chr12cCG3640 [Ipomoea batatas]
MWRTEYETFWVSSWALNAHSEFMSLYPAKSSWGIRERRERAADEVLKSPMPKRSFNPRQPSTKLKYCNKPCRRENSGSRLGLVDRRGIEDFHGGDSRGGFEQGELVRIRIQRTVKKKVGVGIHSQNILDNRRPGELESPRPAYQANRDPRPPQLRRLPIPRRRRGEAAKDRSDGGGEGSEGGDDQKRDWEENEE